MADNQGKRRPPYAGQGDLQSFFDRMTNMQEPSHVDSEWVESFSLANAQPQAIVSVLKWLQIVDEEGTSLGVWDDVRIGATRQAKLDELVRAAYVAIFDQFDDISNASQEDLAGAFIRAYKSGNPGRPITCFRALCEIAEIPLAEAAGGKSDSTEGASGRVAKQTKPKPVDKVRTDRRPRLPDETPPNGLQASVVLNFNIDVPADWTEAQVKERYEMIRRATSGASGE